ncbi:MAG TPA: tRNA (adenosine(37)-N6)-threonylcarbamoyltransferase complex transferase subunit TsaD, partial [Gemmatimonadales bacterium]|nr:tRNA (adenosine(37)-N6)-threonylcarbamoyltransferase complex transferase subunit TsaD [Gemmatimonadales bacterium]
TRPALASCVILSQDIHQLFGGVVPELASRAHLTTLSRVIDQALEEAGLTLEQVDAIAVTAGPGLVGALLVGVMYGKTLAMRLGVPLIGVHHLEGHLFAPTLETALEPPFVALLVSGGHTMLLDVPAWGQYGLLGTTRDDAAGEAFDKVGTLLGLGYPGGPAIERLAQQGKPGRFDFPRPMLNTIGSDGPDRFTFSFSGLKTAVLRAVQHSSDLERDRPDLARGFQDAVLAVLVEKAAAAIDLTGARTLVLGGGVACNKALLAAAERRLGPQVRVVVASNRLNTDNAAMIGAAGWFRLTAGEQSGLDLEPRADLPFPGLLSDSRLPETAR